MNIVMSTSYSFIKLYIVTLYTVTHSQTRDSAVNSHDYTG
jgi:hypothetical protein